MHLNISFKHTDLTDLQKNNLRTCIQEKSETLKKYFHGELSVHWVLSSEKLQQITHCHLLGNHMDYFGEASTTDFKASIEKTLEKLERQIKKHKEILTSHHHSPPTTGS